MHHLDIPLKVFSCLSEIFPVGVIFTRTRSLTHDEFISELMSMRLDVYLDNHPVYEIPLRFIMHLSGFQADGNRIGIELPEAFFRAKFPVKYTKHSKLSFTLNPNQGIDGIELQFAEKTFEDIFDDSLTHDTPCIYPVEPNIEQIGLDTLAFELASDVITSGFYIVGEVQRINSIRVDIGMTSMEYDRLMIMMYRFGYGDAMYFIPLVPGLYPLIQPDKQEEKKRITVTTDTIDPDLRVYIFAFDEFMFIKDTQEAFYDPEARTGYRRRCDNKIYT